MSSYRVKRYAAGKACLIMLSAVVLLTACVSKSELNVQDINLSLYTDDMDLQAEKIQIWWDDSFGVMYKEYMGEYLKHGFEGITFDVFNFRRPLHSSSTTSRDLFQELLRKPAPDLIAFDSMYLPFFIESNYLSSIDHLDSFLVLESSALDELRAVSSDLQLYAIPYGESVAGLFYNKTLFDMMDAPYPRDGMTWDEVFELASQVKNPRLWMSLSTWEFGLVASQIPLKLVDFDAEAWGKWEQFIGQFLRQREGEQYSTLNVDFLDGKAAMFASSLFYDDPSYHFDVNGHPRLSKIDWDVVSYPVFSAEQPVAPAKRMLLLGVPRMAENKEDAYKIIRYLLSQSVQSENMRRGLVSLREDAADWTEEFGSALWSGKSTSFIDRSIPTGEFEMSMEKHTMEHIVTHTWFTTNNRWNWGLKWELDAVRKEAMQYQARREDVIMQLQEQVDQYERFQNR